MFAREFRKTLGWLLVIGVLVANLIVGARLQAQIAATSKDDDSPYTRVSQLTRVMEQIRENYVDASKTSYKDLVYGALRGMLASLDEYSQFLDPEMYAEMKDDTAGEYGGLGLVITLRDGVLTVVAPMEDSPGFRAGLQPGDRIVEIDGLPTDGWALAEAVKKLRGEIGTQIRLKILRPKTNEFKELTLTRAKISIASVKDESVLGDHIAYLRVTEFKEPTAEALQKAVDNLLAQGANALILDLRNNPGGLLTSAIAVAEKFLRRGDIIVSTEGRDSRVQQVYKARGRRHYTDFPMAVLINGGSASAAEILAGALQDHKRAILIGEKTFGKGSVQSVMPLEDGSAIRLTTARYYTPNRRMIHGKGIEPDIVVPMSPDDWQAILMQKADSLPSETSESSAERPKVRDVQLERAIDVLKGVRMFHAQCNGAPAYASAK
jgi:carboxyl-terminal processing protease